MATAAIGLPDEPSGVLMVGSYLDNAFAQKIHNLTKADISFVMDNQITGSSLPPAEQGRLLEVLGKQLGSKEAAHYASWIRDVRAFRDYQLSDELEKLLHEKSVTGRAAWIRLFDETEAGLRFPLDGKELGMSDVLNKLSDTDAKQRREAAKVLGQVLRENVKLFSLVTNTMAKDKATEDTWRSYPRPISERNLSNQVEDHVVDALVASVKGAYPDLSHRYYRLKSEWFGVDALDYWDRNAPLPNDEGHNYSWDEARKTVLNAYGSFDPKMANVAEQFFENNWIDIRTLFDIVAYDLLFGKPNCSRY